MAQNHSGNRLLHAVFPFPGDAALTWVRKIIAILSVCAILASRWVLICRVAQPQAQQGEKPAQAQADPILSALKTKYPGSTPPEGMQEKFKHLYAVNNDVVGWLTIPNTRTDTPILHATKAQGGNDYYLRYNYYHKYTEFGDPFMDYRNNEKELSRNTILYGHNLQGDSLDNGMCFTGVMGYHTLEGYRNAPVITFNTLYKDYKWKVIGAFVATTNLCSISTRCVSAVSLRRMSMCRRMIRCSHFPPAPMSLARALTRVSSWLLVWYAMVRAKRWMFPKQN